MLVINCLILLKRLDFHLFMLKNIIINSERYSKHKLFLKKYFLKIILDSSLPQINMPFLIFMLKNVLLLLSPPGLNGFAGFLFLYFGLAGLSLLAWLAKEENSIIRQIEYIQHAAHVSLT